MPRVTRAALRNNIYEDVQEAASIPLPSTPQRSERAPLGEIKVNEQGSSPRIELEVNLSKPEMKSGKPGRKRKAVKENARPCSRVEVIEDDCESSASSAAEEACRELRNGTVDENFRAPYLDRRPQTPPSKAVRAARRKLSPSKPQTPRFDPEVHKAPPASAAKKDSIAEDSFVAAIQSRTPARIANSEPIMEEPMLRENVEESSIVEDASAPSGVTLVSPGRTPRIEDSVEAIDALEEAIEQVGQSLTCVEEDGASTTKENGHPKSSDNASKTQTPVAVKLTSTPKANTSRPLSSKKPSAQKPPGKKPTSKTTSTRSTTAASKVVPQTSSGKPAVTKRNPTTSTSKPPKPSPATSTTTAAKPAPTKRSTTTSSTSTTSRSNPASTTKPKSFKARPSLSTTTAPFVPSKSSKAPTISTFTLPGEAVSARLKAQREEKRKKEEADAQARRSFKARPVPGARVSSGTSSGGGEAGIGSSGSGSGNARVIAPRPTAASRARESLAKGETIPKTRKAVAGIGAAATKAKTTANANAKTKETVTAKGSRISSTSAVIGGPSASTPSASSNDRASGTSSSSSPSHRNPNPNRTPAPKTTTVATSKRVVPAAASFRPSTGPGAARTSLVGAPLVKSRDAFKARRDSEDQAVRAKMEAAKRARAEAAERGRIASREWAERNLKKDKKSSAAGGAGAMVGPGAGTGTGRKSMLGSGAVGGSATDSGVGQAE